MFYVFTYLLLSLRRQSSQGKCTPLQVAISHVVISAYFYAMCLYEFSLVTGEHCTEIVELKDIRFARRDNSTVSQLSDEIISAYSVGVEFTN